MLCVVGSKVNRGSASNAVENYQQNVSREHFDRVDRGVVREANGGSDVIVSRSLRARWEQENRRRLLAREFVDMRVSCLLIL